ncbi:MarR family winged helix-turn-helix transcriptional regulator [Isoptericola sp. 178]|uniref:MarR family winged helix-turn-helix transcriptional regulator n=1 Tax=Isoptericola sp. 178 TaxID=3064651 RepID=UPI0027140414|nr:MarR family winged helix-turn-helix transcriptional regulator [Isoptericola sp. 178]MDO8144075.1 MarR family winged helix-turn-helix transcriptional regulator [Isoptericola sp. 178]
MTTHAVPGSARRAAETWEALFRAQVTLMRRFQADEVWVELSLREYDVLFTLSRSDDGTMRLRQLNENVLLAQSSLSRMVERLEARGLLCRSVPEDDARGTLVGLTDAGRRLQRRVGARHVRAMDQYVGGALDAEEQAELVRLLTKLRTAQADIPDWTPHG